MVGNVFKSKWFDEQVEREASRDPLKIGDRVGEVVAMIVTIVSIAFIAIHQTRPTGFFTGDSVALDAGLIYLMMVVGMVPQVFRLLTGRRNFARPFEAVGMAVYAPVGLYFAISFPFDISRLAEPLPRSMEFLLDWVPESLARTLLAIGVVACVFFAPYTFQLYLAVKKRLPQEPQNAE